MHISRSLALVVAAAGLAAAAPSALASATQTLNAAAPGTVKADWSGPAAVGLNSSFFLDGTAPGQKGTCGDTSSPQTACDKTLVHVKGIVGDGSSIKFRIDGFAQYSDFDLRVYTSDASGAAGTYLGSPTSTDTYDSSPVGSNDPRGTAAGDYEYKVVDLSQYADATTGAIDQWFAVEIPYFMVANDKYNGHATVTATQFVAPTDDSSDGE